MEAPASREGHRHPVAAAVPFPRSRTSGLCCPVFQCFTSEVALHVAAALRVVHDRVSQHTAIVSSSCSTSLGFSCVREPLAGGRSAPAAKRLVNMQGKLVFSVHGGERLVYVQYKVMLACALAGGLSAPATKRLVYIRDKFVFFVERASPRLVPT